MARNSLRQRMIRLLSVLAVGGSVFQLSSCDPNVRTTLLDGLESTTSSLSSALISAFFLSLDNNDVNANGLTTT